ncbi:hypothetical protein WH357_21140 [Enterobacter ludwigii]
MRNFVAVVVFVSMVAFSAFASDLSEISLDGEVIINNDPCKGIQEAKKIVVNTKQGQSVELVCHHMLPQDN